MADDPVVEPTNETNSPAPAVPPIATPGQETAVDPSITANQPLPPTPPGDLAPGPTAPGLANNPSGAGLSPVTPERIESLKKNLAFLWHESLEITGLPMDTLLAQVFRNAAQQGLPADGRMIDFGVGQGFAPTQPVLKTWLDSYFDRALAASTNNMPEA